MNIDNLIELGFSASKGTGRFQIWTGSIDGEFAGFLVDTQLNTVRQSTVNDIYIVTLLLLKELSSPTLSEQIELAMSELL